jgi:hypothetical protein
MRAKLLTIIALFAFAINSYAAGLNVEKSSLKWTGEKVSGEHWGNIKFKSGKVEVKGGKLTGGNFVVDMTTISVGDLEGEWADKLKGHLKNEDFFNVSKHKTSTLKFKKVKEVKPNYYEVTADLTIKEKTHEIKFNAKLKNDMFTGTLVFDRTKYDVKYGSGSFFKGLGDKMIYDDVKLEFNIATK